MKIIDKGTTEPRKTTLNDIPVGTTFSGTIHNTRTGTKETGTFYKVGGASSVYCRETQKSNDVDVVIVALHDANNFIWLYCYPVTDYRPLDVTLVINGVKS